MDSTTRFDLNTALQEWRRELESMTAIDAAARRELEAHLRDSVGSLEGVGLSTEEAFLIARKRVGTPAALETEFRRMNPERVWIDRAVWMVVGVMGIGLVTQVGRSTAAALAFVGRLWLPEQAVYVPAFLAAVVQLVVTLGILVLGWRGVRNLAVGGGPVSRLFLTYPIAAAVTVALVQVLWMLAAQVTHGVGAYWLGPSALAGHFLSTTLANLASMLIVLPAATYVVLRRRRDLAKAG
ncbi:MAG: hypothetical protein IT580_10130 [Verrucomicrobiales bacterium]|nr:hypothetical protein [Verrucomicrobiales bacterium]